MSLTTPALTGNNAPDQPPKLHYINCCCTQTFASGPTYSSTPASASLPVPRLDVETLEAAIDEIDDDLRTLSIAIHASPEIAWEEHGTHNMLCTFLEAKGIAVTRHAYGLETAWEATFELGTSGPVVGFNSEMDALLGIGHACGHNLIAIAGVAAFLSVVAALKKNNVPGKVILLGTPAEEADGGKINLIKAGAYKDMDICLMVHPAPFDAVGKSLAIAECSVEFTGHTAHAAGAPWEARNAQDAAVLGYNNVSLLRQQVHPSHRVHGIIVNKDWVPNVIPGSAKLVFAVRCPTLAEVEVLRNRVLKCFEAAALATGCEMTERSSTAYSDLRQSMSMSNVYTKFMSTRYDVKFPAEASVGGSTDFGNEMSPRSVELQNVHLVGRDGLFDIHITSGVVSAVSASRATPLSVARGTEVLDLEGKQWIGPGLRDAHVHFSTWSLTLGRLDLSAARSAKDVAQAVREHSKGGVENARQPLIGLNFRVGEWPDIADMTKELLDDAVPDRPVALMSGDVHSMWLNTAGLCHVGVNPVGQTGVLLESAAFAALGILNSVPDAELDKAVFTAAQIAASRGVTSIFDFEMEHNLSIWTRRVQEKGFNLLRVRCAMYEQHVRDAVDAGLSSGDEIPGGNGLLTVGSYKIISDGSLGARTAFCCAPYPGTADYGLWNYPTPTLHAMCTYGTKNNLTLAVHAIGDKANELVLETLASLSPPPLAGSSIEHAQLVLTSDFHLFAKLSLVASIQPEHLNDDKELCDPMLQLPG
ncbi:hypothetical protein RQP46_008242 [Phenoliferia psychrophenolica]